MEKEKIFNNPKDLINETYNGDDFKIIKRTIIPLVMPLSMMPDIDAFDSKYFYQHELYEQIYPSNIKASSFK